MRRLRPSYLNRSLFLLQVLAPGKVGVGGLVGHPVPALVPVLAVPAPARVLAAVDVLKGVM